MRTSLTLLTVFVSSLLFLACAEEPLPQGGAPIEEAPFYQQGLTILDLQPDFSFTAAFAKGEDVIFLQAVRGIPTPEGYRVDPSFPAYEIDARITDAEGRLLYIRRGGDEFIDPTWQDDLIMQDNMAPAERDNVRLFDLIAEASDSLEREFSANLGSAATASVVHELKAIRDFGRTARQEVALSESMVIDHVNNHGFLRPEAGGGGTNGPEDGAKSLGSGFYFIAVHDKSCCLGLGRHSATRIKKYAGAGSYTYFDFCNHGDCAGTMGQRCSLPMVQKPNWTAHTCRTEYKAQSNSPGHNCHDDTRVQLAAFVWGAYNSGYQFWCNDGDSGTDISDGIGDQGGAADCNDSTNKGYNHPSMNYFSASNTNTALQNTATIYMDLSANVQYRLSTCGATSTDTVLRLKNFQGVEVAYNDDDYSCSYTRASTITFTPSTTGTYVLHIGCFGSGACSGNVRVKLNSSSVTAPSGNYYSAANTNSATQNYVTFWVYLSATGIYRFSTCGSSPSDTYLRLFWNSTEMAYNDDNYSACPQNSVSSTIDFTAPYTGYYTIRAGCFGSGSCDGVVTQSLTGWAPTPADPTPIRDEPIYYY